jgi:hypothetical protein
LELVLPSFKLEEYGGSSYSYGEEEGALDDSEKDRSDGEQIKGFKI